MEFKEAMRIYNRICKEKATCEGCALEHKCPAFVDGSDNIAETEAALTKWAAEHPERTIADDFFEKHPKAKRNKDDFPVVCAEHCGYIEECPNDYSLLECNKCWRRPLEEIT